MKVDADPLVVGIHGVNEKPNPAGLPVNKKFAADVNILNTFINITEAVVTTNVAGAVIILSVFMKTDEAPLNINDAGNVLIVYIFARLNTTAIPVSRNVAAALGINNFLYSPVDLPVKVNAPAAVFNVYTVPDAVSVNVPDVDI